MMKLRHPFLLTRSMAVHMPLMPAPMIRTAVLAWLALPMGTSGHGLVPAMIAQGRKNVGVWCESDQRMERWYEEETLALPVHLA